MSIIGIHGAGRIERIRAQHLTQSGILIQGQTLASCFILQMERLNGLPRLTVSTQRSSSKAACALQSLSRD